MLRAYGIGFLTGALAVLLVAVISTRAPEQPGLLWGDRVYSSEREFKGYLKSKGLSYDVWLERNPGVAPWEPEEITFGPVSVRASTEALEDWVVRLPLAALGLIVAACALLGLRRLRPARRSYARGLMAFFSPPARPVGESSAARPTALVAIRRLSTVVGGAARPLIASTPLYVERLVGSARAPARALVKLMRERNISALVAIRRLSAVAGGAARPLLASTPLYVERLVGSARAPARVLVNFMRERNISAGDVTFGLVVFVTVVTFALSVTFLLAA